MRKKALLMSAVMAVAMMTGCAGSSSRTETTTAPAATESTVADTTVADTTEADTTEADTTEADTTEDETTEAEKLEVMSYEEFMALDFEKECCVETYVQAKQGWWEDKATIYTQNSEGAYFLYNMPISKEDYDKLVEGTKIRVTGFKGEFSGEIEILDATYEIIEDDTFVANAKDVTVLLGTDDLANYMNQFVAFSDMTVEASNDDGAAWLYKWDGSGSEGDDLYFMVSDGTNKYQFTVESYLCGADTDVYKAVKELAVGDKIDMEGFLYWYEGANPHITSVVKSAEPMSYADYMAAEDDDFVKVVTYVQDKQSWWNDSATVYAQSADGAVFVYNMTCPESAYEKLVPGTEIVVKGYKTTWSGEVEIANASFTFGGTDTYVAEATDVTDKLGTDDLAAEMNKYVAFNGLEVVAANDDGVAYLYRWDGSGSEGDDLYFNVTDGENTYSFTVESYLRGADTDVYKAVKALKVGDKINAKGFLYWYEGANPHITSVSAVAE